MHNLITFTLISFLLLHGHTESGHGQNGRIGILISVGDNKILKVYKNTPAAIAGLRAGDIVRHVYDKDITGPVYTEVTLVIKRNETIFKITIERIPCEDVDEKKIQDDNPL